MSWPVEGEGRQLGVAPALVVDVELVQVPVLVEVSQQRVEPLAVVPLLLVA